MNCKGKTAKGEQCSRKVKDGEYCFQHKIINTIPQINNSILETKNDVSEIKRDITKTICLKIDNLRKCGYTDLKDWMSKDNNVYVGRGRIFITYPDKSRETFVYAGNKFGNVYKVGTDGTIEEVCKKYRDYILNTPGLLNSLLELKGKTLGCFCRQDGECHAKILKSLVEEFVK